jgi:hypothetical protein
MKKIIYNFLLLLSYNCTAQNLVPNPNFEQFSVCPFSCCQISYCTSWNSYRESPDYFNNCSTSSDYSPPNCYYGFQYPHSGNAYVGISPFHSLSQDYRELIGSPLNSLLIVGQKYYITLFVNLSGNIFWGATIATNKIGVKFSSVPYSYSNPAPINNFAHITCNDIISDTVKWTQINGSFVADSAYSYIIIGNFFTDSFTDTIDLSSINNKYAYYYIDDVCVSTDSLYCENWTGITQSENGKENITIYPNPCINQINVQFNKIQYEPATLSLLDITGKVIIQAKTEGNEFAFNTAMLPAGLYLVKMETGNTVALQKVVKE